MTWRSIKDDPPPKDGTIIVALKYGKSHNGYTLIFWDMWESEWAGYTAEDEKRLVKFQPTHWMQLPEPPDA